VLQVRNETRTVIVPFRASRVYILPEATMTAPQSAPAQTQLFAIPAAVLACASAAIGCGSLRSAAEGIGLIPLDSARAVAVAQHNVCGDVSPGDPTCVLRGYRRSGGRFEILLDRRPPAGNDRVLVTLSNNGSRIDVTPVDTASARPLH
jgi:hypothetical protein